MGGLGVREKGPKRHKGHTFGARNPEPGTRNPEPGTRNPEPGTRNPEPGTRNPEPRSAEPALSHLSQSFASFASANNVA